MSDYLSDPIHGHRVIVAPDRIKRPHAIVAKPWSDADPASCPFCPGNEHRTPPAVLELKLPNQTDWAVRVIPNLFPVVASLPAAAQHKKQPGASGNHEVIVESAAHVPGLRQLTSEHRELVFLSYHRRLRDLSQSDLQFALLFKNHGMAAGASQYHIHSQLLAMHRVPDGIQAIRQRLEKFHDEENCCWYCHQLQAELEQGRRIVDQNDDFVAYCPAVSRAAFETWILPKRHASNFELESELQVQRFARFVSSILARLENSIQHIAYNFAIHSARFDISEADHYHWHMVITPRLAGFAGFEINTGVFINPIDPIQAARSLQAAPSEYSLSIPPKNSAGKAS